MKIRAHAAFHNLYIFCPPFTTSDIVNATCPADIALWQCQHSISLGATAPTVPRLLKFRDQPIRSERMNTSPFLRRIIVSLAVTCCLAISAFAADKAGGKRIEFTTNSKEAKED